MVFKRQKPDFRHDGTVGCRQTWIDLLEQHGDVPQEGFKFPGVPAHCYSAAEKEVNET